MEELKVQFKKFNQLPIDSRIDKIKEILDFYVAGENKTKMLVFFLLLGSYHSIYKPIILIRGDSSGGKNHMVNSVLKLYNKKHVYITDSSTDKGILYDESLNDDVKIIYVRELTEQKAIIEFMKSMFQDKIIHKETIMKKGTREHVTKTHELDQRGIITTFSFENVQVDLVNRAWVFIPDQTYQQNIDIIKHGLDREKNLLSNISREKKTQDKCFFISQCIVSLDWNYEVYIPYIDLLHPLFPSGYLNVRRDKDKLINLIKIITIWNQEHRRALELGERRFLLSEYDDLVIALQYAQDFFLDLLLHLDGVKRSILDYMEFTEDTPVKGKNISSFAQEDKAEVTVEGEKYYAITEIYEIIRDNLSISRKTVKRKMDDLFFEGYLQREKIKNRFLYKKLRGYDLPEMLELDKLKAQIDIMVHDCYEEYTTTNFI